MSTRKAIIILSLTLLVAVLLLTKFGTRLPFLKGEEADLFAKPDSRPERPDLELVEQYKEKSMGQIFDSLAETASQITRERSMAGVLLENLPDAPFPFPEGAIPADESALKEFVETVEKGKLGEPNQVDKWRYNLAVAALGKEAESIPEKLRLTISLPNETENFPITMSPRESDLVGPIAIGNFDDNEFLEIVSHGGSRIWTMSGDGSLVALEGLTGNPAGIEVCPADYDGDGDLDLFVARGAGMPNSLLENDGKAGFRDVTIETGLLAFSDTTCAEWVDYDGDGRLDIAVGNRDHPFEIYRQSSPGKFEAFSWNLDLWYPMKVEQIKAADLTGDGYPELFISINGKQDQLLFSLPSSNATGWRFLERSNDYALSLDKSPARASFFDFDNDGDLDLAIGKPRFVSGKRSNLTLSAPATQLFLFQNEGDGTLIDVTTESGLPQVLDVKALHVIDIDNDGFEELLAVTGELAINRAFWNRGGMRFRDISLGSALSYLNVPEQIHSIDMDGDGAQDLFLTDAEGSVKWLESESPTNGWLQISLGNAPPGTRVSVLARDHDWILHNFERVVGMVPQLTIGLGDVDKVEQLDVFPPQADQSVETLKKIKPNQSLEISLPGGNAQPTAAPVSPSA